MGSMALRRRTRHRTRIPPSKLRDGLSCHASGGVAEVTFGDSAWRPNHICACRTKTTGFGRTKSEWPTAIMAVSNAQFSEIKSYHKNDCLSSEEEWFSWGNVKATLRGCNRGSHQEWTQMHGGLLKSKDGKCLEYSEGDSYVYMRDCNSWSFEQKWTVLDGE